MGPGLLRREPAREARTQLGSGNRRHKLTPTHCRRKPDQSKRPLKIGDISRATSRINAICVDNRPHRARRRAGACEPLAFLWSRIGREPVGPGLRLGHIWEADSSHTGAVGAGGAWRRRAGELARGMTISRSLSTFVQCVAAGIQPSPE